MLDGIRKILIVTLVFGMAFGVVTGCESGDKAIDEAAGNRALKQYEMSKNKLNTIDEKHKDGLQTVPTEGGSENK
jgi:hypothetical protein